MILMISDTLGLSFDTIAGVQCGFEIIGPADFAKTNLPIKWSMLINLAIIRLSFVKYFDDEA